MVARVAEADRFFENCGGPPVSATALKERLRLILEVRPGERALLPSFGCRVHELPAIETEHERRLAEVLDKVNTGITSRPDRIPLGIS
mgnify:CR=1 FL=1